MGILSKKWPDSMLWFYTYVLGVGIVLFLVDLWLFDSMEKAVGFVLYWIALMCTVWFVGYLLGAHEAKNQLRVQIRNPQVFSDSAVENTRTEWKRYRDLKWVYCLSAVAAFSFAEHWSGYFISKMDINFYILILVVISVLLVGRFTLDYFSSSD